SGAARGGACRRGCHGTDVRGAWHRTCHISLAEGTAMTRETAMSFTPGMRRRSARTIVSAGGIVRRTTLGTLVSQRENLGRTPFTVDFDSGQRLILFAHEIEPIAA